MQGAMTTSEACDIYYLMGLVTLGGNEGVPVLLLAN